jgi:hypothetical protein
MQSRGKSLERLDKSTSFWTFRHCHRAALGYLEGNGCESRDGVSDVVILGITLSS